MAGIESGRKIGTYGKFSGLNSSSIGNFGGNWLFVHEANLRIYGEERVNNYCASGRLHRNSDYKWEEYILEMR